MTSKLPVILLSICSQLTRFHYIFELCLKRAGTCKNGTLYDLLSSLLYIYIGKCNQFACCCRLVVTCTYTIPPFIFIVPMLYILACATKILFMCGCHMITYNGNLGLYQNEYQKLVNEFFRILFAFDIFYHVHLFFYEGINIY